MSDRELFLRERELDIIAERLERGEITASELFECRRRHGDALDAAINKREDMKHRARLAGASSTWPPSRIGRRAFSGRLPEAADIAAKAALTMMLAATAGLLIYLAYLDGATAIAKFLSGKAF